MKKSVFIFTLFLALFVDVLYAKPTSKFKLEMGPYLSSQSFELGVKGNFSLNFWVAHVESDLFVSVSATNNTIKITPHSSNVIHYAKFDWKNVVVEYGATQTHSNLFLTTWDVGKIPSGWKNGIKIGNENNSLSIFLDRDTYDVEYLSSFFFSDFWWYENAAMFTVGLPTGLLSLNGGKFNDSYFIGIGGKYGNFSAALVGFSNAEMVFQNMDTNYQIPSRYVGIFEYNDDNLKVSFAMSENEFYLDSSANFSFLQTDITLWASMKYVDTIPFKMKVNGGIGLFRKIAKDTSLFLKASYDEKATLWFGTEWGF
ncbi:hypothetical protein [Mesoaciditoga lauensis]|uniref:hypothetical protein n=1 Tax=Mesoaciditoga lauensis TaxID=1495039 RepID=UPI00056D32E6|nr:hypothetical protein [Mesoaciditoga lauensis]